MKYHENETLRWLSFELLDEAKLINAVILKPLNMGFEKAADQAEVLRNFETVRECFGLDKLSWARQRHEAQIVIASDDQPEADALLTSEHQRGLLMTHADCQIAGFYDPIKKVIGSAHAGWRGNVKRLYIKTVKEMQNRFGSQPENLLVVLSPSLGPTKAEFIHWEKEFPSFFWPHRNENNCFDLWKLAEEELLECGILPHHIQMASLCTYEGELDFFSYRRAVHQGLQGAVPATNATLFALPGISRA